jgi:hypothetical protein
VWDVASYVSVLRGGYVKCGASRVPSVPASLGVCDSRRLYACVHGRWDCGIWAGVCLSEVHGDAGMWGGVAPEAGSVCEPRSRWFSCAGK